MTSSAAPQNPPHMNPNCLFVLIWVVLLMSVSILGRAGETSSLPSWTSADGRVIQARFVRIENKELIIEKDGKQFSVPISNLSKQSIEQANQLDTAKATTATEPKPDQLANAKAGKNSINLDDVAHEARAGSGLDGLGIAVIRDFSILGVGCDGKIQRPRKDKLQQTDSYVIASCSKSMTATLAAVLVTKSVIKWETTLGDVFPELKKKMNASFTTVTLAQLLAHSAGAPERDAFWQSSELQEAITSRGNPTEQRLFLLKIVTSKAPRFKPGSESEYSNAGYYIAASMLEKATGKSWESMMSSYVFEPLGMATAVPTSDIDPPLTMPAGGISGRMEDLAKFYLFHLAYKKDNSLGISEENFNFLHTKYNSSIYGMGFILSIRPWANGTVYTHVGICNKFTTVFWLSPGTGLGIIASTPESDESSGRRLDKAVSKLIEKYK